MYFQKKVKESKCKILLLLFMKELYEKLNKIVSSALIQVLVTVVKNTCKHDCASNYRFLQVAHENVLVWVETSSHDSDSDNLIK